MSFCLYNTITNTLNVHLTANASLRVPPLLAYDLSNLDVILLLLIFLTSPANLLPSLTNLQLYSIYTTKEVL